jgi:hypothetical protein
MNCPKCGKEMLAGHMLSGGGKCWLFWYPKGNKPSAIKLAKHAFPFFKKGSPEKGMLLYPWTDRFRYLPSWNCPDCELALLDYNEDAAEEA